MRRKRAIALKYHPSMPAPFLCAKGSGDAARRMESLAREHGVPVVPDQTLAGFLFPVDVGSFVPEEYWEIVARLYILISELVPE